MSIEEQMLIGLNAMSNLLIKQANQEWEENKSFTETLYIAAVELNPYSSNALEAMAIYYELKKKNFDTAEEYYLRALDCDAKNTRILVNFEDFWIGKDEEKMIYYYDLAVKNCDIFSMFMLADFYYVKKNNIVKFLEY